MTRINTFILILFCLISYRINSQNNSEEKNRILLKDVSIIDAISDSAKKGSVLIEGKVITKVKYQGNLKAPKGTIIYNLDGKYVIPGLIDAHVHLGTDPSGSDNIKVNEKRLAYLLKNGVTTVRDMAGDTRYLAYLSRSAMLNEIESPDIYYSALMAGNTFFDDPRTHSSAKGAEPGNVPWMKAVDLETNFPLAIAQAKGTGATGIKIYADLDSVVIQKVTEEAHRQNLKVWAHASVFPAKPLSVVNAGVDVLSHSTLLAWEGVDFLPSSAKRRYISQEDFHLNNPAFEKLIQKMKEIGCMLDATLAIYKADRFDKSISEQGVELTKLAHQQGVKIGVGTDNLNLKNLPETAPILSEMQALINEVGMTNLEAIQSATIINAEIIGIQNLTGSIEVGKLANLVVLQGNPLEDIEHIGKVDIVIKRGVVFNP